MYNITSKLTKRITVEVFKQKKSDNGVSSNWEPLLTTYAHIEAISNYKKFGYNFQSMQLIYPNPYLVVIRYKKNINAQMRIKYGDRILGIKRIINYKEANYLLQIFTDEELS